MSQNLPQHLLAGVPPPQPAAPWEMGPVNRAPEIVLWDKVVSALEAQVSVAWLPRAPTPGGGIGLCRVTERVFVSGLSGAQGSLEKLQY